MNENTKSKIKKLPSFEELQKQQEAEEVEDIKEKSPRRKIEAWLSKRYEIRYNVITGQPEIGKLGEKVKPISDERILNDICAELEDSSVTKNPEQLLNKILRSSYAKELNPIKEYFESLEWDGRDHIRELCNTITLREGSQFVMEDGTQPKDHWYPLMKLWLITAVACGLAMKEHDVMLVLQGGQGQGKTSWLNKLCPPLLEEYLFTGAIIPEINNPTTVGLLMSNFIINLDDQLETIQKKYAENLKSIISSKNIKNRIFHTQIFYKKPRIANMVGSVNKTEFLQDTENRRYFVVPVNTISWSASNRIDINQVWAQAYHAIFVDKVSFGFDKEKMALVNNIANLFMVVSIEQDWICKLFISSDKTSIDAEFLTTGEITSIIKLCSGLTVNPITVGKALKILKFTEGQSRRDGSDKPVRGYWVIKIKQPSALNN